MAQPMETVAAGLTAELTGTRHYQEGIFIGVGGQRLDLYMQVPSRAQSHLRRPLRHRAMRVMSASGGRLGVHAPQKPQPQYGRKGIVGGTDGMPLPTDGSSRQRSRRRRGRE